MYEAFCPMGPFRSGMVTMVYAVCSSRHYDSRVIPLYDDVIDVVKVVHSPQKQFCRGKPLSTGECGILQASPDYVSFDVWLYHLR